MTTFEVGILSEDGHHGDSSWFTREEAEARVEKLVNAIGFRREDITLREVKDWSTDAAAAKEGSGGR